MFRRRRPSREDDLDRELRTHLEEEAEELQDSGMARDEALHTARRALGNFAATKEEVRLMWGWHTWDVFVQELRYAMRSLRRNPGFSAMAVATLALGIGASTAVFTIVDSVLLKPLSYRDSGSLVAAWERVRYLGDDPVGPNPRHVDLWRTRATAFSGLTVMRHVQMGLAADGGRPRLAGIVLCMPNLFDVLEVRPLLGRTLVAEDGVKGRENVAVLTYSYWQAVFRGEPGVIGRTVRIDDVPAEIVGVLPADFHFPNANALRAFSSRQPRSGLPEPGVFLPAVLNFSEMEWNGNFGNWVTVGRLKPGVSGGEAETQLNAILAQAELERAGGKKDTRAGMLRASVQPMQEAVVGASSSALWLLMAAVFGLMLMASLNLANAQLGRALARRRDAAVRTALGAARWRLIFNGLAENLVLAAAGGTAGFLLAAGALNLFRRYSPLDVPRLSEVELNLTVLLFAVVLTLAASLLTGILPALRLMSTDPQSGLQQGSRTHGSRSGTRLRTWLIGFQVFGCTVLLLVTGLFSKSLLNLLRQDKGFDTGNVGIAEVKLPLKVYSAAPDRIAFIDSVLQNLRSLPGAQGAGMVSAMPLEGESWIEPLERVDRRDLDGIQVNARWVSPGYFETMRQRLVAGSFFEERDRNLDSVVLSEGAAKALWPTENPLGGQVRILGRTHNVIGIAADTRSASLKAAPVRMAYVHYKYRPPLTVAFVFRSRAGAEPMLNSLRDAIWHSAPSVTVARVKTLDSQLTDSVARERFQTLVLMSFGAAALLLAMLGIYGVLSYSVTARKQEIGVRMALGATRSRVYAMTLAEAGAPVCVGLVAGLTTSMLAGRVIRTFLYGTEVVNVPVILAVIGVFVLSAAAAAVVPARRAASVDPMSALRAE